MDSVRSHAQRLDLWLGAFVLGAAYIQLVLMDEPLASLVPTRLPADFWWMLAYGALVYAISVRLVLRPFRLRRDYVWNLVGFACVFFAALHWDYVGKTFPWLDFSLKASHFARMGWAARLVFAVGAAVLLGLAVFHWRLAVRKGYGKPYAVSILCAVSLLAMAIGVMHRDYRFHLHHYNVGMMFLPWLRFQHPVTLVCLGLSSGVFVEGVTRYGMDPVWYAR